MDKQNISPPQEISGGADIQPQLEFRPLEIRGLFKRAWAVYKSRFRTLIGIAVWIVMGSFLLGLFTGFLVLIKKGMLPEYFNPSRDIPFILVIFTIGLLFVFWSAIALLFAIHERGQRIGIIDSFRKAWHKLPSYIWILILLGLYILGGTILLIIPGIIFFVWFSFSSYVLVAEDIKGKQALARSQALVKGHWWKVFWILIISYAIQYAILYFLDFVPIAGGALCLIFGALMMPFVVIFAFLVYEDLRGIKLERAQNISHTT